MFYTEALCRIEEFASLIEHNRGQHRPCNAARIVQSIPIYDCTVLRNLSENQRAVVLSELADVLMNGAGVFVLEAAFVDHEVIDAASEVIHQIIEEEQTTVSGGDHFAAKGANDRIWNALEKFCIKAPAKFADYYANDMIALAAEAWLGPNYQVTSQINVVRPGGKAQQMHRDYHLGFQTAEQATQYPAHMHHLSPSLTLQGAVAHCDMPIESGPTKLLPYSQLYKPGYVAWRRKDFIDYFEENCVQLPLEKGDAVFFNPALFHAAGDNVTSDISRMANLLQISSAFGRAMESVDRSLMSKAVFPYLRDGHLNQEEVGAAIAATAEGYPFPTNLDRDPPIGGLAAKSQQDLLHGAISKRWTAEKFNAEIDAYSHRRLKH